MAFGVGALPPGQIKMACRQVYPRRSRGRACVCFGTALVHCWPTTLSESRDCWSVLESMETRFRWSIAGLFSCPVVTSGPLLCFKERRLINAWRSSLRRSREIGECISNIIIIKGQQSAAFNSAIFTACVFIVNDSTSFYLEFLKIFWANSVFLVLFILSKEEASARKNLSEGQTEGLKSISEHIGCCSKWVELLKIPVLIFINC